MFSADLALVYLSLGRLLRTEAPSAEIALVDSATTSWSRAFSSIPLCVGDILLTTHSEDASNYLMMLQRARRTGAVIQVVPPGEDGRTGVTPCPGTYTEDRLHVWRFSYLSAEIRTIHRLAFGCTRCSVDVGPISEFVVVLALAEYAYIFCGDVFVSMRQFVLRVPSPLGCAITAK